MTSTRESDDLRNTMQQSKDPIEYSPSVYSEPEMITSPDRPGTPSSFECYIMLQGGRSSAAEVSPSSIQHTKQERLTDHEEYRRAIFNASFLQAENGWLRRTRKSAIALHEGTVMPTAESLALGAEEIHHALAQFHIVFGAAEHVIRLSEIPAASDVASTIQELIPAFESCRRGLEKIRTARKALEKGGEKFSMQIHESNRSYEKFFGIGYNEDAPPVTV